jgi:hypothetical protein
MTTFGKVLVFVNLVFSLVVCALIIMVYVTRTQWQDAFNKQQAQASAASASASASAEQLKLTVDETRATLAANEAEMNRLRKELEARKTDLAAVEARLKDATTRADQAKATIEKMQVEVQRSREEGQKQEQFLAQAIEAKNQALKEKNEERQLRVAAQIDRNRLMVQNAQLVTKMEELQKELIRTKQGGTAVAGKPTYNPPRDDVEGVIKSTDPSGLVTLSIGGDSGIEVGQTLEVYRLEPSPLYLGTVRIRSVRPHEAVAQPVSRPRAPLQMGDRVAAKITPGT